MEFEWDRAKAESNRLKHGIRFELAAEVFTDPGRVEVADDCEVHGEARSMVIGRSGRRILTVVFVEREDRTRIISDREATRDERQRYFAPPPQTTPPGAPDRRRGGMARRALRCGGRGGGRGRP